VRAAVSAEIEGTVVDEARRVADRAARAAEVSIRPVTPSGVSGVQDLLSTVWGPAQRLQANLLLALSHAGATVAAAVRDDVPIGACVGFLGWSGGVHLHSHMAAVRWGHRTGGVGYALKLWQRAVCLEHGVDEIRWTYDPLVRRNAYFNLAKLGARVVDYLPDFYGQMDDIVNAGDRSDRFEVSWALVDVDPDSPPDPPDPTVAGERFVALPEDYDALRREDPAAASRWRDRARAEIAAHWDDGLRPVWTPGGYRFQPAGEPGGGRA
jgi:predicted GNAT superfamily acetyltransferase